MNAKGPPYKIIGWVLFFFALAVFTVYHISHGLMVNP
jgi:hypothetical protein